MPAWRRVFGDLQARPSATGDAPGFDGIGLARHPSRWGRLLRHRWHEESAHRLLSSSVLARLESAVLQSEHYHCGEIRICVEGGLPLSYLWRRAPARERALVLFGKLGVWNTEQNNGVLIYLLMADHAIEIVADRGLAHRVPPQAWVAIVEALAPDLRAGRQAEGLARAIQQVDALLQQHFPLAPGDGAGLNVNELPNRPVVL